jgi:hypothetical protein
VRAAIGDEGILVPSPTIPLFDEPEIALDRSHQFPNLQLSAGPSHVLGPDDVSYFARLRKVNQMQGQFLTEQDTEEQLLGAIGDMA